MLTGGSALQIRCFLQDCLRSRPQLERGELGLVVIVGGVKLKLLLICFLGAEAWEKERRRTGARLAHLLICWRLLAGSDE